MQCDMCYDTDTSHATWNISCHEHFRYIVLCLTQDFVTSNNNTSLLILILTNSNYFYV